MSQDGLRTRKLCQSPMPDHCCNSGIIRGASPRCFPYTITRLLLKSQHVMRDTALEFGPPSSTGKLIQLLLEAGTSRCPRSPQQADGILEWYNCQKFAFGFMGCTDTILKNIVFLDQTLVFSQFLSGLFVRITKLFSPYTLSQFLRANFGLGEKKFYFVSIF